MALFIFCCVGLCLFCGLYLAVYICEKSPEAIQPADCIIVLGSRVTADGPSRDLEGRLERAYKLYVEGYAQAIIVCGAKLDAEPIAEAQAMQAWLLEKGIPQEHIFLDTASYNTRQNLENAQAIMEEQHFMSAILCTSDFHGTRAAWLAARAEISCTVAKSRFSYGSKWMSRGREVIAWVKYALGL